MREYVFIDGEYRAETVVNRSRFIASVKGEVDADEAQEFVAKIKKEHQTATHNCYAYIAGEHSNEARFSDDGEPQGTAGQPMLEVLKKRELTNTVVVVTRYFGGVKLGANGLVSAYSKSVINVLDTAVQARKIFSDIVSIGCSYSDFAQINTAFGQNEFKIIETDYSDGVRIQAAIPEDFTLDILGKIKNITSGRAEFENIEKRFVSF